jgi:hypothetical protein
MITIICVGGVRSIRHNRGLSAVTAAAFRRTLLTAATVGSLLVIDLQGVHSQTAVWRSAVDDVGNECAPAGEAPGVSDGADFSAGYHRDIIFRRGKVTIESSTTPLAQNHGVHRRIWATSR